MNELSLDESRLKDLLKIAIVEVIQEKKELFSELLAEIIEDIALEKAIQEGEETEAVNREAIFQILDISK